MYIKILRLAFPENARRLSARWNQSPQGKAAHTRYTESSKGRAYYARYNKTDSRKQALRRYQQSPKGRLVASNWRKRHPEKEAAKVNLRRARKRDALVPGTEAAIKEIYDRSTWLRSQGWNVEVDHIFPLGFGWHEPANLQIIFACENAAKNCRLDFKPSVVFA